MLYFSPKGSDRGWGRPQPSGPQGKIEYIYIILYILKDIHGP